jgi:hypothetical protein
LAKQNSGNKNGALEDYQEAARLYQQQGNTIWYKNSQERIKELGG